VRDGLHTPDGWRHLGLLLGSAAAAVTETAVVGACAGPRWNPIPKGFLDSKTCLKLSLGGFFRVSIHRGLIPMRALDRPCGATATGSLSIPQGGEDLLWFKICAILFVILSNKK